VSLIQLAPTEAEAQPRAEVPPDHVLEMDEAEWYERVYRGADAPQLTWRALAMGSALGFILAFTNLYVGLKTGWSLGVAITAAILAYGIWNVLLRAKIAKSPMTILETNCMQSTASAAGAATVGTVVSAISALLMLSVTDANPKGEHLPWAVLAAWVLMQAALGTVLAIPMKRNMINREKLKFPSGTAAAVTLHSLYSEGTTAMRKAKSLFYMLGVGMFFPLLIDLNAKSLFGKLGIAWPFEGREKTGGVGDLLWPPDGREGLLPAATNLFDFLPARGVSRDAAPVAYKPSDWTLLLDHNPVMIGAGAIIGLRTTVSMLVASLVLAYVIGPWGHDIAWTSPVTNNLVYATSAPGKAWKEIGVWLGVPIMVSSGLLAFAMQWRTIARAFSGFGRTSGSDSHEQLVAATEVPTSWFAIGTAITGAGVVAIAATFFSVPWYYGILAVAMTFFLSLVACRATGETDITPIGAMGKIMQLTYGVLIPQSMTANLMTASITSGASGASADLLNDLKSGYLLGANPRRQFVAQMSGLLSGTVATVVGFHMLVPNATALTGDGTMPPKFPAPAAQTWKAVAEVMKHGVANMHPAHQQAIVVGLAIGAILLGLEIMLPKLRPWLPSPTGVGLGLILPFQYPFSMFLGAVIAWLWNRSSPKSADDYLVPMAAGLIAGVSLMGVIVAVLNNLVLV
jgi:uncharacterized oligopeptide transporter (OPT) family protein